MGAQKVERVSRKTSELLNPQDTRTECAWKIISVLIQGIAQEPGQRLAVVEDQDPRARVGPGAGEPRVVVAAIARPVHSAAGQHEPSQFSAPGLPVPVLGLPVPVLGLPVLGLTAPP